MRFLPIFTKNSVAYTFAALFIIFGASSARADWRKDLGVFRIGIIESEASKLSPREMERVRAGYAAALKMPVEIIRARDFPALIDAQASARIEYAIFSAAAYSAAYLACECIEPLVAPAATGSVSGTKTVLFLDSALSLSELAQSKGIAIPDRNSLNGYGVLLIPDTLVTGTLKGDETWLTFVGNTSEAVQQFIEGKVDGFIATVSANATLETALDDNNALTQAILTSGRKTKAAWISGIVASGPHAVRKNLSHEAKALVSSYLVNLVKSDPDLNDLLLPAQDTHFATVGHANYGLAISATKMLATHARRPAQ